jgi:nucleotide-binding universal stress UspA family protein
MSTIIVATDFSTTATNAVHYACQLAIDIKAKLIVSHCFTLPIVIGSDMPMPAMTANEGKELADTAMIDLINTLQPTYPSLEVTSEIRFGEVLDVLQEMIEEVSPLLVIMGNKGTAHHYFWMDNNMVEAMRDFSVPVLGIPESAIYKVPKAVCFASDFSNKNIASIEQQLQNILKNLNATIHILTIVPEDYEFSNEQMTLIADAALGEAIPTGKPIYHFQKGNHVNREIASFIQEHPIEWLVLMPHQHPLLEQLFTTSHTETLVKAIDIPLLAISEATLGS